MARIAIGIGIVIKINTAPTACVVAVGTLIWPMAVGAGMA
jgi:hypothetical protein